jgi:hypothetical protein
MKHYCDEWIQEWCDLNGWTDLFMERCNNYWAFPPGAVMPEPIPLGTLSFIKTQKGMSKEEKTWVTTSIVFTLTALILSCWTISPMPIVFAFAFDAFIVAQLEVD